ncbi:hypothetical protein [Desertihabitans aurantiacus]|uniref:hypothetical protein n=1 Tax=Desertihabitans aurantiacus TaxID=2282477 RepID=UPI0013007018|nr:hypothetical protein [Desertihabitans aurantiacus]
MILVGVVGVVVGMVNEALPRVPGTLAALALLGAWVAALAAAWPGGVSEVEAASLGWAFLAGVAGFFVGRALLPLLRRRSAASATD